IRTLCLTGSGARNRPMKIWKVYLDAMEPEDPILLFVGHGDQTDIVRGVVTITAARASVGVLLARRKPLWPATGCHPLDAPGAKIVIGNRILSLEPRIRG